ncbi:Fc.00g089140.m01.CDS01 [Cosmosporella sp. VM-42]
MERPTKRQRVEDDDSEVPESLTRPISPPTKKRRETAVIRSPWQLTWIRDAPEVSNQDSATLKDLLGDPLISECWEFNFLHDIHFLMDAFDPDTRHLVKVHVVHGFWKREDSNRLALVKQAAEFSNVKLHCAFMPEIFGTHHSKMMILFRHDETAQVIIHTANMISKDWTNMANAVWKSPLLPKTADITDYTPDYEDLAVGGDARFKVDLLNYLKSYDRKRPTCKPLIDQLTQFDFSSVKAALIASVPGRHNTRDLSQTPWGWPALKRYLSHVPSKAENSEIVVQVSSIATLGGKDDWLQKNLFQSLANCRIPSLFKPKFKIVFPTADEIRRSFDGYSSGGSIHTNIKSDQQTKQLRYLRPILHHWANDSPKGISELDPSKKAVVQMLTLKEVPDNAEIQDAGRQRAAPHIKTYIKYNQTTIDWALLTSANLSKQAWGESIGPTGEVRVASYEIGVLVWPELWGTDSKMVGSFKSDTPQAPQLEGADSRCIIGLRIPYNLPLQRYENNEIPWVADMVHAEPDWMGRTWGTGE